MSERLESLRAAVRRFPSVLLGFSGGVDSALLAVVLRQELGVDRMLAALGSSASLAAEQREIASALAARFDVPMIEVVTHEVEDPRYVANPTSRCFFCKTELWDRLSAVARERGLAVVCDGTNADDLGEHRPGAAAGTRAGVRSPLAEVGLTKDEIRTAAREVGLPNWNAPAAPCLASRVQYGLQITPQRLREVEAGEVALRRLGVTGDLRVRHLGATARIEVEPQWIPWVEARRDHVTALLREIGFADVVIDPHGYRRGSLLGAASR
jgi:pyridinium-3,5-biscarboxylic acid mononucleotide sulfurtransferase